MMPPPGAMGAPPPMGAGALPPMMPPAPPAPPPVLSKKKPAKKADAVDDKEIANYFHGRAELSKKARRNLHPEWKRNVELRIGRVSVNLQPGMPLDNGEVHSTINPDWALTKAKTAMLYSQVPEVQGTHENAKYAKAIPPFMKQLNYELGDKRANVGVAMEEVLNDVVNAAGIGFIEVGYAARFEDVDVPTQNTTGMHPDLAAQVPTQNVPRLVDDKFFATRGSPTDLLWPSEFVGSNFDDGDWIGRDGKCSWPEALNNYGYDKTDRPNGLKPEDKDSCLGSDDEMSENRNLRAQPEAGSLSDSRSVEYSVIYYWRYKVDPDEKCFRCIWKLVYIKGRQEPVVHEPWRGQKKDPTTGKYIGSLKFPIRVLTLTYITDNPVPPSDSAAGRPQILDMQRSRGQMFKNRERSIPIRWFDVNRIDPTIQDSLMRGTWQGMIPTNGDGSRSIGEIARASYPSEDLSFDQSAKQDLQETWQMGANQLGNTQTGRRTGTEASITQQNFSTRIGQEKARVANFFLGVVEVKAGLVALYSDFPILSDEERTAMQQAWDSKSLLLDLVLKIRPDSQIVLDSEQRIDRLERFLNLTAKSGYVNVLPIIAELAELSGLDPSEVITQPPPPPNKDTITWSFSGAQDLQNPMVLALLMKEGKAPDAGLVSQAAQLLHVGLNAGLQAGMQPPQPPPGPPGGPMMPPGGLPPPGMAGPPPAGPLPSQPLPGAAHPEWTLNDKVMKRGRDANG